MSNIVPFDKIQVPAFLQNRTSATNSALLAALPTGGGFPMIGLKGTRFVQKADCVETPSNSLEISVVIVASKSNLDKTYYASKYDPNQTEAKSPDCFSKDGIKPDPSSTMKQCESCAGCPMNQFGSGTDNQGNPGKGKACSDTMMLAIYAQNGVFGFKVTPSSLKALGNYVRETSRRGVDLSTGITVIGFDPAFSFPVLTFNFGGFLAPEQVAKIEQLKTSVEVTDIVGGTPVVVPVPVPVKAVPPVAPAVSPFDAPASVVEVVEVTKPKVVKPRAEKPVEVTPAVDDDLASLAAELGL